MVSLVANLVMIFTKIVDIQAISVNAAAGLEPPGGDLERPFLGKGRRRSREASKLLGIDLQRDVRAHLENSILVPNTAGRKFDAGGLHLYFDDVK